MGVGAGSAACWPRLPSCRSPCLCCCLLCTGAEACVPFPRPRRAGAAPAAGQWQGAEGELGLRELVDRFQALMASARDTASSIFGAGSLLLAPGSSAAAAAAAARPAASAAAAGPAAAAEAVQQQQQQRRESGDEAAGPLGAFELIEGSAADAAAPPPWARVQPPPLSLAELSTFLDAEGAPPLVAGGGRRAAEGRQRGGRAGAAAGEQA